MRRSIFSARPARAVCRAFGSQQPRRTFATPSTKQVHPIGPFYEAILRTPEPLPEKKPEVPPVTSQESPTETPKPAEEKAAKPATEEKAPQPAAEKPSKPAAEAKPAAPAAEEKAPEPAQEETAKPARKPRKPRQSASSTGKAKSVPSSSSSSTTSSSFVSTPAPPTQTAGEEEDPVPRKDPTSNTPSSEQGRPSSSSSSGGGGIAFSPSLAGPRERAERLARIRTESRLVAGIMVPPKPEEPDNCCMSGCVNCVWDRYRDEMEDWAGKSAEADRRVAAAEIGGTVEVTEESMDAVEDGAGMDMGETGMDDDGGGRVANWDASAKRMAKDFWDEELYKNVPVGIREFMKQEKRLKEKHLREGTMGG